MRRGAPAASPRRSLLGSGEIAGGAPSWPAATGWPTPPPAPGPWTTPGGAHPGGGRQGVRHGGRPSRQRPGRVAAARRWPRRSPPAGASPPGPPGAPERSTSQEGSPFCALLGREGVSRTRGADGWASPAEAACGPIRSARRRNVATPSSSWSGTAAGGPARTRPVGSPARTQCCTSAAGRVISSRSVAWMSSTAMTRPVVCSSSSRSSRSSRTPSSRRCSCWAGAGRVVMPHAVAVRAVTRRPLRPSPSSSAHWRTALPMRPGNPCAADGYRGVVPAVGREGHSRCSPVNIAAFRGGLPATSALLPAPDAEEPAGGARLSVQPSTVTQDCCAGPALPPRPCGSRPGALKRARGARTLPRQGNRHPAVRARWRFPPPVSQPSRRYRDCP